MKRLLELTIFFIIAIGFCFCFAGKISAQADVESLVSQLGESNFKIKAQAKNQLIEMLKADQGIASSLLQKADEYLAIAESGDYKALAQVIRICEIFGLAGSKDAVIFLLDKRLLRHKNSYVQIEACRALGRIHDQSAVEPITGLLHNLNPSVVLEAIRALANIGSLYPEDELVRIYRQADSNLSANTFQIKLDTAFAFGEIKSRKSIGLLTEELSKTNDAELRNIIAEALGKIGDIRAEGALKVYLQELKSYKPAGEIDSFRFERYIQTAEEAILKLGIK